MSACVHTLVVSLVSIEVAVAPDRTRVRTAPRGGKAGGRASATVSPAQNPVQASEKRLTVAAHTLHEQVSDELVMKALHTMQDHLHRRQ